MPAPTPEFKRALRQLSDKGKEELLLKAARRDAELYDLLRFELLPDVTVAVLQEEAAERIAEAFAAALQRGRIAARSLVRAVPKAAKEIARAKRLTKDKRLEVELNLWVLNLLLEEYRGYFEGPLPALYVAAVRVAVRTARLVPKLHEDLWLEYKPQIDEAYAALRAHPKHRILRYPLPAELELPG